MKPTSPLTDSSMYLKLLDTYAPLQKLTNAKVKLHPKPWLGNGVMKCVRQKDKIYKLFSRDKDCQLKQRLYKEILKIQKLHKHSHQNFKNLLLPKMFPGTQT